MSNKEKVEKSFIYNKLNVHPLYVQCVVQEGTY